MSLGLNKHLIQPPKCFILALKKTPNSKKLLILKNVYQKSFSLKYQNKKFYSPGISFKMKQSGTDIISQNVPFDLNLYFLFSQAKNLESFVFPGPSLALEIQDLPFTSRSSCPQTPFSFFRDQSSSPTDGLLC